MASVVIEVEQRKERGKNEARRLRGRGLIPGILYGAKRQAVPVTVNPKDLDRVLHSEAGENTVLQLKLKGKDASRHAMIKEYQSDPLSGKIVHADFIRIDMDQKITVNIPLLVQGIPEGVTVQGGLLEVVHREVEVECLPSDIPEHIDIDVTALNIGDHIRVEDLSADVPYRILDAGDSVLITVVAPREEEPEAAPEGEEAEVAEPEVISKGKDEEEAKPDAS